MRGGIVLAGALCAGLASPAIADDKPSPICPTRPGKATAVCTVPAGHVQLETGLADWSLQTIEGERDTSLVIGETSIKYGLTSRSDIELDVTPFAQQTSRSPGFHDRHSSFGDLIVSYKNELTSPDAALQLTVLPFIKAPTAKQPIGNGRWEGGLLVPILYTIGKSNFSINLTPELDWAADGDGHGHHAGMTQVASLGYQANQKLSLSAEIWGHWDWDPAGTTKQASVDGSIAYLLSNDVQLDAGSNFGLNRNTPDVEVYSGVSVRF